MAININKDLSRSIEDKNVEIHYNEHYIKKNKKDIHIELHGKIKCPVLNQSISSTVCCKMMDKKGWPRQIDSNICNKCGCFIHLSIMKFKNKPTK